MYFLRKDERIFDKYLGKKKFYLKIWEKVSNKKSLIVNLYIKKNI